MTWYSKALAVVVFSALLGFVFYVGSEFGKLNTGVVVHGIPYKVTVTEEIHESLKAKPVDGLPGYFTQIYGHVFHNGQLVPGLEPEEVVVMNEHPECRHVCYFRDTDQIWSHYFDDYKGYLLEELNDIVFGKAKVITNDQIHDSKEYFLYDGKNAYHNQTLFENVDPNDLRYFEESYYLTDGKNIYTWGGGGLLHEADYDSFHLIDWEPRQSYIPADKDSIFFGVEEVDYLDPGTFEIINATYVKDKDSVAYLNYAECDASFPLEELVGVDVKTFAPVTGEDFVDLATDKYNTYRGSKKIEGREAISAEAEKGDFIGGC